MSEREIVQEFSQRRQRLVDLARKLEELNAEVLEHETVIKTLEPMETGRKCFRLVGDVLVERTVGETLPAVTKNKDSLKEAIKTLSQTYEDLEKQLTEFQKKHKIRFVDRQGRPIDDVPQEDQSGSGSGGSSSSSGKGKAKGSAGVLVDK